ncbi:MAG: MptD family putative ECF transporter S component [Clostridiales bacterium]|uniref:MptD family putative ECF transporter S component n=1 Tax=Flavonifractor porci TaxID=3133422 RepID=UPI0030AFDF32|nr:MptD family putative ECF transporter S component [Clostridiales bacterium]
MNSKKFQAKDLVVTALLMACGFVLYALCALLAMTPYTMVLVLPAWSILAGITYFLVAVKTKNPFMLFIYTAVMGMIDFYIPCILLCITAAAINLLVMRKKDICKTSTLTLGWVLTTLALSFGGMYVPFLFMASQTMELYADSFGTEYLQILTNMTTPWFAVLMLAVTALCALLGSFIANRMLKKHFEKAGVV